ncbi:MAG: ATP-binding protein [Candidatus Nanohalobium sp.]
MSGRVAIKRLKLDQYGPLSDIDVKLEEGLNAFYGGNESGKTLMVEAVTKMLLEDTSEFSGIGRVPQRPNGLLNVKKGDEVFDAAQEDLEAVFGDVTVDDVRNAFIVRDFDLRLPERENDFRSGDYFKDVTDRILGSKTKKIQALRNEISDIGYLTNATSESKLENTKNTGKLGDKKKGAGKLRNEIEQFQEKIQAEGLYRKYRELETLQNRIESKQKEISELKKAEKQTKYRKGMNQLEKLRESNERIQEIQEEKKGLKELEDIREKAEDFEKEASPREFSRKAFLAFTGLAGASVIATVLTDNILPVIAATLSVVIAAASAYVYRKDVKAEKNQEQAREQIIEEAEAHDIEASTLPELVDAVNSYEEDIEKRKEEVRGEKKNAIGQLQALFSASYKDPEDWKEELNDFSNSFESVDREFQEGNLEKAEEELEQLEERKKDLQDEVSRYDEMLKDFDKSLSKNVAENLIEDDPVDISSIEDLDRAERQIDSFMSALEENVEASRNAINVLEEIEEEEEDEFNRIFNEDSYAVEMFEKATGGNYTDIRYDRDARELKVVREDGREFNPEALSQGTYDLLYMSVRLKLAREILGEPGFLILDNAFVHSDTERVEKELEFLEQLEDEGWQIIYFTFRDDVKNLLEDRTTVEELSGLEF